MIQITQQDLADIFCYTPKVNKGALMPCPNCKTTDYLKFYLSDLPCNCIECKKCGVEGPYTSDSYFEAQNAWNQKWGQA